MYPARSLVTALIALLLLTPAFVLAQAPDPAKDPIDAAIDVLWNTTKQDYLDVRFATELDRARRLLVEQRDQSFKKVAALLNNNEVQVRLNAAIILADMAKAGAAAPELLQALKRCVADSNPAMAQWGAAGILTSPQFPDSEKLAALTLCLKANRPRPLRVAAVLAAGDAKLTQAIPVIIGYLESIKGDYRKQVETALTPQTEGRIDVGPGGAAVRFPADEGRPYGRFDDKGRPYGRFDDSVADPASGRQPMPQPPVRMTGPSTGGPYVPPAWPGAPVQPAVPATPKKALPPLDPAKLTLQEQEMLIQDLEELPTVMELHHIGLALEALVNSVYPGQKSSFEFESTPPWALNNCVDAASKWLAARPAEEFNPAPAVRPAPAAVPTAPAAVPAAPAAVPPAAPAAGEKAK